MNIVEITIVTHFGQHKACDFHVRTEDGKHLGVSQVWDGEAIDEQEVKRMLGLFAAALGRSVKELA